MHSHRTLAHRPLSALLASALTLAFTAPASAQKPTKADRAEARKLLKMGVQLMNDGMCEEAIAKFKDSLKIVPSPATQINIGTCHQELGRTASAWAAYREAENLARTQRRQRYVRRAKRAALAIEGKRPRLVISAPDLDEMPEVEITRNLNAVDRELLGTVIYVDPGEHFIVAAQDGYQTFEATIEAVDGGSYEVEIPLLEPEPEEETPPVEDDQPADEQAESKLEADTDDGDGDSGNGDDKNDEPMVDQRSPSTMRTVLTLSSLGVGSAAVVVGLGFGWSAKRQRDEAFDRGMCERATLLCSAEGQSHMERAHSRALWSTIATGAGLAIAGAGLVLYLSAPGSAETRSTRVLPVAGPDQFGVALSGSF